MFKNNDSFFYDMGLIELLKERKENALLREECVTEIKEKVEGHLEQIGSGLEAFILTSEKITDRNISRFGKREYTTRLQLEELKRKGIPYEITVDIMPGKEMVSELLFLKEYKFVAVPQQKYDVQNCVGNATNPNYEKELRFSMGQIGVFESLIAKLDSEGKLPPKADLMTITINHQARYDESLKIWESTSMDEWEELYKNGGSTCGYCMGTGEIAIPTNCKWSAPIYEPCGHTGWPTNGEEYKEHMKPKNRVDEGIRCEVSHINSVRNAAINKLIPNNPIERNTELASVYVFIKPK